MTEEYVNPFEGTPLERLRLSEWDWQITQPKWTLNQLIPAKSIGMLVGASNSGKSHLICDLVMAMLTDAPTWHDIDLIGGDVVMFSESMGHIQARMKGNAQLCGRTVKHKLFSYPTLSLEWQHIQLLGDWLMALPSKPQMIVFDTVATSFSFEENDNREASRMIKQMEDHILPRLSPTGCIALIHHTSKASEGKSARGASALIGNIDWSINVSWDTELERTIAKWEKDRWRIVKDPLSLIGEPQRVPVNFTNGQAEVMVLDWSPFTDEEKEAHKKLKEEQRNLNVRQAVIQALREAIEASGWVYIHSGSRARPPKDMEPWKPPMEISNKDWGRVRDWILDNATGDEVKTANNAFAGKKIWGLPQGI